ncbi:topoisomerase DNA-binding C4 zinc finger domain-containing protein, partial [Proteus mirabilis]
PAACTDPGMTALWEQSLEQVAQGNLSLDVFMQKQISWLAHLIKKGGEMPLALDLPPMPSCPSCQGKMVLRENSKGRFWSCQRYPDCKGVISLSGENRGTTKGRKKGKKILSGTKVIDFFP